jgi:hypothetical protein
MLTFGEQIILIPDLPQMPLYKVFHFLQRTPLANVFHTSAVSKIIHCTQFSVTLYFRLKFCHIDITKHACNQS